MAAILCIAALHSAGFSSFKNAPPPSINNTAGLSQDMQGSILAGKSRKRQLPSQQQSSKHIKPSTINQEFLKLTDQLNELMQFCKPKLIIDHCSSLKASEVHDIAVFPIEFLKKLQNYSHTPLLLRILSSFWNWNDHSILRVLLKSNNEALKMLDEFASQINSQQQLVSYPIALPSPCMMPNDSSTHTVLAVKCAQEYHQCLLKHVFEVQSQLMQTCHLTPHSLQLLAAKNSSTILYWLIPKSTVTLISTKVLEYSSLMYNKKILEISILPGIKITTKAMNVSGSLAFLSSTTNSEKVNYIRVWQFLFMSPNLNNTF